MFENWKEFKGIFNKDDNATNVCESCGMEDFDLLCTEKEDEEDSLSAVLSVKTVAYKKR